MAGTTPRGYPYPHDPDPINVALDIELLAEAIDSDLTAALEGIDSEQDAAQNAAISALQVSLTNNYNADAADRARMEAINTALSNAITANNNVDTAQQNAINGLQQSVNKLASQYRVYAAYHSMTLNSNGYGEVFFPTPFGPGQIPIVHLGSPYGGIVPAEWNYGTVWGTAAHGFACYWQQNGNLLAGSSVSFMYIAIGPW